MTPMGRPKSDNPKDVIVSIRLDRDVLEMLRENTEYFSESKTDSIRRGIEMVNEIVKQTKK